MLEANDYISGYILTAAKFQWAWMSIHREVLQVHWTFSLDCKPKRQKSTMHLSQQDKKINSTEMNS